MDYKVNIGGGDTAEPLNVAKRLAIIRKVGLINKTILDCGCGKGDYIPFLLTEGGKEVYGIEYNHEKVNAYNIRFAGANNVIQGNIENMPYADQMFDLILLNEVLEHVPDHNKGLEEIYRILKPGGKLVLFSPNRIYPFETHGVFLKGTSRLVSKAFPFMPYIPLFIGNIIFDYRARNYFPYELRKLLKEHNFGVEKHTFITQTFEGIGGLEFLKSFRSILRGMLNLIEKIPFVRIPFSASQVIIGMKAG